MPTVTDTTQTRVFKYGIQIIPDPGPEYSNEQVLGFCRTYFPELGQAKSEEKTLENGTREITFSKQGTTKG